MGKFRQRVVAQMTQNRQVLESCESAAVFAGSTDVSNIQTSVDHKEGGSSISFDKSGTTEDFGMISKTYAAEKQIDLNDLLQGKVRFFISLSALTNVDSVDFIIGADASNNVEYNFADSVLSTGWNELQAELKTPSVTNGNGADWTSIGYLAIRVNFDATGNTLTSMLVDMVEVYFDTTAEVTTSKTALDPTSLPSPVTAGETLPDYETLQGETPVYKTRLDSGEDQANDVQGVIQKPIAASTYSSSVYQSTAIEGEGLISAVPANLTKLGGRIDSTVASGDYYLQLINDSSIPADGLVTFIFPPVKYAHTIGTNTPINIDATPYSIHGSTGLVWCISTTEFTKTSAGAVASIGALYK